MNTQQQCKTGTTMNLNSKLDRLMQSAPGFLLVYRNGVATITPPDSDFPYYQVECENLLDGIIKLEVMYVEHAGDSRLPAITERAHDHLERLRATPPSEKTYCRECHCQVTKACTSPGCPIAPISLEQRRINEAIADLAAIAKCEQITVSQLEHVANVLKGVV